MLNYQKPKGTQMKSSLAACYSLMLSWFVGFAASVLQFFTTQGKFKIIWPFLIISMVFLLISILLGKIESKEILAKAEWVLIAGNIISVVFALGAIVLARSLHTLSGPLTTVGIALGLPSILTLFYLSRFK